MLGDCEPKKEPCQDFDLDRAHPLLADPCRNLWRYIATPFSWAQRDPWQATMNNIRRDTRRYLLGLTTRAAHVGQAVSRSSHYASLGQLRVGWNRKA